jgi:hypothetical protein
MRKGGPALKAFVPQLQTTFVKTLNDPMREVRQRGGRALGQLLLLGPRADPLVTDLIQLCLQVESHAIKLSVLEALGTVLATAGGKATAPALVKAGESLQKIMIDEDDAVRLAAARCLGLTAAFLQEVQLSDLILDLMADKSGDSFGDAAGWVQQSAKLVALGCVLQAAGARADEFRQEVFQFLIAARQDERVSIKIALAR